MPSAKTPFATLVPAAIAALAGSAAAVPPLPFPAAFELSSLNGDNGFVIKGIGIFDYSGICVSSAGDVNGDGFGDLIIGAPRANPNAQSDAGQSYVVFGGPGVGASGVINLSSLNGANGFRLDGVYAYDNSGRSVSSAGDVNGDGIDDLVIGADNAFHFFLPAAGKSYVVFGRNTALDGPFPAAFDLSTLDGANGFACIGVDAYDHSGYSVSSAGDVNGDGIGDLVIGAYRANPNAQTDAGQSYVVFGGPGVGSSGVIDLSSLNGANGFRLDGVDAYDTSGRSVSSAGDVNGDGIGDLIIGAAFAHPNAQPYAGESYVVFGRNTSVEGPFPAAFGLWNLDGTNGFVCNGIDAFDLCGRSVASAGDVNGDSFGDLLIAAFLANPNAQTDAGQSYVVFGGPGVGSSGVIDLSSLNGANGFRLDGVDAYDTSGRSVSSAGDVNGDGIGDLIIGAYRADPNAQLDAGESYVVFGGPAVGSSGMINLSSLNGANGFRLDGVYAYDNSGRSVSSAGDVNGDGIDDLVIGAFRADPNGVLGAGESYVIFGRAPASCDGDVNGDGATSSADFNILAGRFGQFVAPGTNGDLTGDGHVNSSDFNILAGDFGCGL